MDNHLVRAYRISTLSTIGAALANNHCSDAPRPQEAKGKRQEVRAQPTRILYE